MTKERHIIDAYDMDGYEFSHYTKPYTVLKEGISKKKGEPIYPDEIEYIVPASVVLKKKPDLLE